MMARRGRLPPEYQEVEYIEATGTQYVDTGVYPTASIRWEADIQFVGDITLAGENFIGGNMSIGTNTRFTFGRCGKWSGKVYNCFQFNIGASNIYPDFGPDNDRHTFFIDKTDNTYGLLGQYQKTQAGNFYANITIPLFVAYNSAAKALRGYSTLKMYENKFYFGGVLSNDYIPCYRKADTEIGLYDIIGGSFLTNLGTGTFLKGPDVL